MSILNKEMEQLIRKDLNSIMKKWLLDIEVLYNWIKSKTIPNEWVYKLWIDKEINNFSALFTFKKRKLQNIINPLLEEAFVWDNKEHIIFNKKEYINNIRVLIPYNIIPIINPSSQKEITYKVLSKTIFIDFNQKRVTWTFMEAYIQKNNRTYTKLWERIINTIWILNIFMRTTFYEGKGKNLYQINDNNWDGLHTLSSKDVLDYLERKIYFFLYDFKV